MKLLIHICCAPDATMGIERLTDRGQAEGFFYNPNIHPEAEYLRRLNAMKTLSAATGFKFIEGPYDPAPWHDAVRGLEKEPEKGRRCAECIRLRLRETARMATEHGFDHFAAVLTVSPHKNAEMVNRIGQEAGAEFSVTYVPTNLKKQDGFRMSVQLSRAYGLYRQNYCGCVYSLSPDKDPSPPESVK